MSKKKGLKLEKSNSIVITFKLENVLWNKKSHKYHQILNNKIIIEMSYSKYQ